MRYDLIIIGAGAAGLFAAANVPSEWKVLLLEKTEHLGQKLLMAGSGQCNLTNAADIKSWMMRYGANGKRLRSVLYPFSNRALMEWFEERGLALVTRPSGKVFPASMDSRDVLRLFLDCAAQNGVELRQNVPVTGITPLNGGFDLHTPAGRLHTGRVLVTTGGASYPHTGSDGSFFDCLEALGVPLTPRHPALVPVHVHDYPYGSLSGISFEGCGLALEDSVKDSGDLLFTHRGFSGPVVLNNSRYVRQGTAITLNYLPGTDPVTLRKLLLDAAMGEGRQIVTLLEAELKLPRRFLEVICRRVGVAPEVKASQLGGQEMGRIASLLTADMFTVSGTGGFGAAAVTTGGVSLDGIDLRTMQSLTYPGLHFAGEVLDVDGDTGGYNLQFAFSSAMLAVGKLGGDGSGKGKDYGKGIL